MKFKVGDRIRAVSEYGVIAVGSTGCVIEVIPKSPQGYNIDPAYYIQFDDQFGNFYRSEDDLGFDIKQINQNKLYKALGTPNE